MGATNTTTHYNLSQFVSTDKPAWLQDYNGDMLKIDTAIDAAKVAADTAQTTANAASGASTQNANDIAALSTDVSGQGANITALQLAVNTINSLIGNGTPTTTDQTIIGAINELHSDITDLQTDINTDVLKTLTNADIKDANAFTALSGKIVKSGRIVQIVGEFTCTVAASGWLLTDSLIPSGFIDGIFGGIDSGSCRLQYNSQDQKNGIVATPASVGTHKFSIVYITNN